MIIISTFLCTFFWRNLPSEMMSVPVWGKLCPVHLQHPYPFGWVHSLPPLGLCVKWGLINPSVYGRNYNGLYHTAARKVCLHFSFLTCWLTLLSEWINVGCCFLFFNPFFSFRKAFVTQMQCQIFKIPHIPWIIEKGDWAGLTFSVCWIVTSCAIPFILLFYCLAVLGSAWQNGHPYPPPIKIQNDERSA